MQFEHFDAHDGLNSDFITAICQDSTGFMYFAGYQQLIRYDGHVFEDFTHDPMDITSIGPGQIINMLVTRDGKIWLGMRRDGLNVFDPKTQSFQRFSASDKHNSIGPMIEDQQGVLWAGTDYFTLLQFDRNKNIFTIHHPKNDLFPNAAQGRVVGIVQDQEDPDILWLTFFVDEEIPEEPYMPYQIVRFEKSSATFSIEPCKGIVMHQDEYGLLWCGSWAGGLWRYDPKNKTCENIRFDTTLQSGKRASDGVFDIKRFDDLYWVCSRNAVIAFTQDLHHSVITMSDQYGEVNTQARDNTNNTWIGTSNGLMATHPGAQHIAYYSLSEHGSQERIYPGRLAYEAVSNTIYLVNRNEARLYRIPLDQQKPATYIPTPDRLYGVCVDAQNRIIVATQSTLMQFDPTTEKLKKIKIPGFENYTIPWLWSMEGQSNGQVAGVGSNEFFWWDGEKNIRFLHHPLEVSATASYTRMFFTKDDHVLLSGGAEIHDIDVHTGRDKIIQSADQGHLIKDDLGNYWLGTITNIGKYQLVGDSLHLLKYYTSSDGLINITATHLHLDYKNRIWIFSNGGMSVIDPALEETRNIGVPEGLSISNIDPVQVINLDDGRISTVNNNGLIVFHPDSLWKATTPADVPVVIKDLRIEGLQDNHLGNVNYLRQLSLSSDQNTIDIQFQGLAYPRDRLVTYSYKVEGIHEQWINLGKNNSVTLSRIPPGDYVFKVKTGSPDGKTPVKSLSIHIATPFWMQAWFLLLCFMTLIGSIVLLYRSRVRKIKKMEEEKTRINKQMAELELQALRAQMNPHFMFNSLNSIKNYILKNETTKAAEYLSNFSHLIRMILQNSREKTVSLQEELDTLLLYIDLEKLRFRDGFEFSCQIDDRVPVAQVQIPPMIVQPFIENAIWHGLLHKEGDRHLVLRIREEHDAVLCEIEDDGIGRQAASEIKSKSATQYKSMGMGITQDRITLLNSMNALGIHIAIIDKTDAASQATGTLVKINIPYARHSH